MISIATGGIRMAFKQILVPIDFSPCSLEAYRVAVSLARFSGATLHLLHVIDRRALEVAREIGLTADEIDEKSLHATARRRLREFLAKETDGVPADRKIVTGLPFQEIVRATRQEQIDLIVMGRYGGGELEKIFFGSTAEKVVRIAPCAVLSIPLAESRRPA
ncbi:MAG: universal stress protein [Candidatus Manganitrophus sp. SA1]|nr:universal stress protein [Candidatus Manganitrophus morganii]